MKIILGSKSPRRKIILSGITDEFKVMHPDADESIKTGESPVVYSERISADKAKSIFRNISRNEDALIISCDTIVCLNGEIFGKPESYDEAFSFLKKLSGKTHSVISSICLIKTNGLSIEKTSSGTETTLVSFLNLSDEDIENYLSKTEYMDKAGAYAAQENGNLIIGKIDGSLTNVIGFPLRLFFRMLIEYKNYTDVFQ
jgi:septum formation protein